MMPGAYSSGSGLSMAYLCPALSEKEKLFFFCGEDEGIKSRLLGGAAWKDRGTGASDFWQEAPPSPPFYKSLRSTLCLPSHAPKKTGGSHS